MNFNNYVYATKFYGDGSGLTGLAPLSGTGTTGTWPISISGNAASSSAVAWSGVSSKPNSISGYGILDAASLTTNAFTGIQTFVGLKETAIALAANDINLSLGTVFSKTISASPTTFTVSNPAASGLVSSFILELTNGGAYTVNWWTGTGGAAIKWASGTAPTLTSSGVDVLGFYTRDGGVTWRGFMLAKDSK